METNSLSDPSQVHYLVIVHGMGEPREGATVLPVINRMAEIRAKEMYPTLDLKLGIKENTISLGRMLPAGGRQKWVEFKGIPIKTEVKTSEACTPASGTPTATFLGEPSDCGTNIRFVDLFWGDITTQLFPKAAEPVNLWTRALINRVEQRWKAQRRDKVSNSGLYQANVEIQLKVLLDNLRKTLIPIQQVLSLRFRFLSELIFDKFIGDVQLYAEYMTCREDAIKRFHAKMSEVHRAHDMTEMERKLMGAEPRKPVYHVIAHSLGTVMSLDALVEGAATEAPWFPFVKNYVTLGSPIDKFLMLWPENYHHLDNLNHPKWKGLIWSERASRVQKIRHFNYCDEQDPVGHNLDFLEKKPVIGHLFETIEDKVFVRYPVPGKAHVDYWTDVELFRHILHVTIDDKPITDPKPRKKQDFRKTMLDMMAFGQQAESNQAATKNNEAAPVQWYLPKVYKEVTKISYVLLPLIFWTVASALLLFFGLGTSFAKEGAGKLFDDSELVSRTLLAFTFLGGYGLSELLATLTGKSFPEWIRSTKRPALWITIGITAIAPVIFTGIITIGTWAMLLIGILVGILWLYFRVMELMIQWRQMTVMLTDATNKNAPELEDRMTKRIVLRIRIAVWGFFFPALFLLFGLEWFDRVVDLRLFVTSPLPVLTSLYHYLSRGMADLLFPIAMFVGPNPDYTRYYNVIVTSFVLLSMTGSLVYVYRALKYFIERNKTIAMKQDMQNRAALFAPEMLPDARSEAALGNSNLNKTSQTPTPH
ncbi:MAG TPA: hypothetical protein PLO56_08760 [Rhodothermales bacterium]|nr:hypothetical protein [Rhodothermales bacterium]